MNIINTIKNAVAPEPIGPSADDLRAEFAAHGKRVTDACQPYAWVTEFETEAAAIQREFQSTLQNLSTLPTKANADAFVAVMLKTPRADALRLAVETEGGKSENVIRAARIQSLRGLLRSIAKHAAQVGDDESVLVARKREDDLGHNAEDADRFCRAYITAATDKRREVEIEPLTKSQIPT